MQSSEDMPKEARESAVASPISESLPATMDRLLAKYVHVWLGTMVLSATTGVGFSILTYAGPLRWGMLGPVFALIFLGSLSAAVLSWIAVLQYWSNYLIPLFFGGRAMPKRTPPLAGSTEVSGSLAIAQSTDSHPASVPVEASDELAERAARAAVHLRRSITMLLLAGALRAFITLLGFLFSNLGGY
jgi:hypothetical protein